MVSYSDAPIMEPQRQFYFMDIAKGLVDNLKKEAGRELTYHVETFGCQMNAKDSEKLRGILEEIGYIESASEESDFTLYNTCTVRENANNKVYGRLGLLGNYKKKNKFMKLAMCGCMMQEPHVVETLKKSYRFVDLVFGTHNIYKLAELIVEIMNSDEMVVDIYDKATEIVEDLPVDRKFSFKSGVNIMFGCDNFCSYCIVPYVRGRERSRKPKDIIHEVEKLAAEGVVEIMLLGQNVNSYGKGLDEKITFAELLKAVADVKGIKRVRFMTSHPKDLSDELIEAFSYSDKICTHMHLPLQSGSNKILKEMNRHYTREQYIEEVEKLRAKVPGIAITTDIIVGFPTETNEDFEETLDLVRKIRYDSAFTFIYSKRSGTPAAEMDFVLSEAEIKSNFDKLLKEVQAIGAEKAMELEGKVLPVLVEQINSQDDSLVTGRLSNNSTVHLKGDASMIGQIVNTRLVECKGFYYYGEPV